MGADAERKERASWIDYVHDSVQLCRESIDQEHHAWDADPHYAHLVLYFCLTAIPPEQ
ncbi:hypothetical protein KSC_005430 [Ktedonobacter sp. SOSP1-52]|uniref:hypothetical protein n=1 Tax=Ktedonobacter sp. SOSP1-52 TaxID=2778366 RepID=UPI001A325D04|nr:hypothetical protein [Ktedonobacter sp. SOSP1-52]GHO61651.1 hypothetical protein KSC_005430 [Ktedonobacter sp. SOSP1-52]